MIVRIKGGMGNQMFQYILLKQLELNYGVKDIKADFSFFTKGYGFFEDRLSLLDVHYERATENDMKEVCYLPHNQKIHTLKYKVPLWLEKTFNPRYFFEPDRAYRDPSTLLKYSVLDGYWQSWQYLKGIEDIIKKDFNILYRCSEKTKRQAEEMSKQNAVLVGVRKGDYALESDHYFQIGADYQEKAAHYIAERIENPVFHVFTNDVDWVRKNMNFGNLNVVYRDKSIQVSDVEEMQLMQACKHAIIPNSTFHWLGSFLIPNDDKIIIRPEKFFCDGSPEDLFPPTWKTIK
ncbi:MAG: alpha-1,2-fucosyltransferase [Bacteroidota bacterium]|nr:alpha-1,2-fucosyltransferase [Bacteroidota bacterium]